MSEPAGGKAYFMRDVDGFTGKAKLFKVEPEFKTNTSKLVDHVVVVAIQSSVRDTSEIFLIPSNADGDSIGWCQLDFSTTGDDHAESLRLAGYEVIE